MNNNIIGSGTILIEEKLTYGGCKMGHLENIIINKKYRGKGYGEKLIKELLSRASIYCICSNRHFICI